MSEETTKPSSILDEDLSSVDTNMPILPVGVYDLVIAKIEEKPNSGKTGVNLNVTLKTTVECRDTTGAIAHAGFPIFHNISQTPTDKYPVENIRKANARFMEAVGVKGRMNPLSQFEGKIVRVKLAIEPESDQYPEKNKIKAFVPVGK